MIRLATILALLAMSPTMGYCSLPASQPGDMQRTTPVARDLPDYERVSTLSGTIRSVGSSTTASLLWGVGEQFKKIYPEVEFDIKGGGSATAPPALIGKNPPNLGPMSRPMNEREIASFKQRFGYEPTAIRVAVNALGIFVNADNPCQGLTMAQLDAIFSRTCKTGSKPIKTWGETGLGEPGWAGERVLPYTLDSTRGEYGFVKDRVLLGGEFRYEAQTELTSSAVVEDAAVDRGAIGYASMLFRTRRARTLPIQGTDGSFYEPTYENCLSQKYPLADFLYIYVNKSPGHPLDRPTREFLVFTCCRLGQEIAAREGGFPLTAELAREQLEAIGK